MAKTIQIIGTIFMIASVILIASTSGFNLFAVADISTIFKTNAEGDYSSGTWIAFDIDSDGKLEGFDYTTKFSFSSGDCTKRGRTLFGLQTPEGYEVVLNEGKPEICILKGSPVFKAYHDESVNADLTIPCDEGDLVCNGFTPRECVNNVLTDQSLKVGFCGVECLVDSDCEEFNYCEDSSCKLDTIAWYENEIKIRDLTIQEQADLISSLEATLSEKIQIINSLNLEISELNLLISELEEDVSTKQAIIDNLEVTLEEKETLIASLQSQLNQKEQEIASLTTQINNNELTISEQAQRINELDLTVNEQADLINALETDINSKAQLISNLELDLSEKSQIINNLQLSLSEKTQLINSLESTIEEKNLIIQGLEEDIITKEELIKDLQASEQEKAQIIQDLKSRSKSNTYLISGGLFILGLGMFIYGRKV